MLMGVSSGASLVVWSYEHVERGDEWRELIRGFVIVLLLLRLADYVVQFLVVGSLFVSPPIYQSIDQLGPDDYLGLSLHLLLIDCEHPDSYRRAEYDSTSTLPTYW